MQIDEVVLRFLEGENEGVEIKLTPTRELNIGRSEESDVFLGEKKISRKHCQIFVNEDEVRIVDLESTNGSYVNGKKISEMELKSGDKVKVGSSIIDVRIESSKGKSKDESKPSKSREKVKEKSPPRKKPTKKSPESRKDGTELDLPNNSSTMHMEDLGDLEDLPKSSSKKKAAEEDSDLVVEYQSTVQEMSKNLKKTKEHETSERVDHLESLSPSKKTSAKAPVPEPEPMDDFEEDLGEVEIEEGGDEQESFEVNEIPSMPSISDSEDKDDPSFNRIMEMDELKGHGDVDVGIGDEEDQPQSSKPLVGDLSAMGLSDLLQNLYQNKKTGVLTLTTGTYSGKIFMREGQLLGAQSGEAKGIKAMYRMLTWKTGDFEFQPLSNTDSELDIEQEPIQDNIETILMEGYRHYDELRKIQKVLPQIDDELALEDKLEVPISKLHPKVLDVVQLIINHKSMRMVLDLSPFSDLETSKIVFYLMKKKVIKIKK